LAKVVPGSKIMFWTEQWSYGMGFIQKPDKCLEKQHKQCFDV